MVLGTIFTKLIEKTDLIMKVFNKNVWQYFENYKDSDKLEGLDTKSRRYYLEQIHFEDRSVYAITTSSCTPTRVVDTIKVVEFDSYAEAKVAWRKLKAKTNYIARITFGGVTV